MNIIELKKELLQGKVRHFYIFTGEELALQDIYINKISEISGLPVSRPGSILSIYNKLTTKTLLKSSNNVYVIRNDEDYMKSSSMWSKLLDKEDFKGNILILTYSYNESSEFSKKHTQLITRFDHIGPMQLVNRLIATTGMRKQNCEDLVTICRCNYGRIKNELYKLIMLSNILRCSMDTAYLKARSANFIHEDIGDIIFDFTNAILERNVSVIYDLLPKVFKTDDGVSIKLLSVLYNGFRNVLMVQTTPFKDRTEEVLGLTKGQIYMTSQKCGKYNDFEVVNIIKTIRYLEKGIKTGIVEDKFAMDYLLGEIL